MATAREARQALAAFIVSTLFAGLNAIGVRFTVMELAPFWGAAVRFAPAALLLAVIAALLRLPRPAGRGLAGAMLYGAASFGGSYAFIYWGMREVQAGMAQVILSLVPLQTLALAIAQGQERFRWRLLIGSLLAAAGVALVFARQVDAGVPLPALVSVALGGMGFAEGAILVKRFPRSDPIATNAVAMAVGAAILFVISRLSGEEAALPSRTSTWLALGYLVLLGSCLVFVLVLFILRFWPASKMAYQFVLLPFVAVTASSLLENERLSPILLAGAALVITGVYLGAFAPEASKPVRPTDSP